MGNEMSENAAKIISEISADGQKLAVESPGARENIILQARRLIAALETPMETILQTVWEEVCHRVLNISLLLKVCQPTRYMAIRLALDLKFFETLAADGGSAKSVAELCKSTDADPVLVARLTRHLAACRVIREVGADTYAPTTISNALALPQYAGAVRFKFVSELRSPCLS